MAKLITASLRFVNDRKGVTALEYGLIAAGIAVVIIAGVNLAGDNLQTIFDDIAASLTTSAGRGG